MTRELWKWAPGAKGYYKVSTLGRVKRIKDVKYRFTNRVPCTRLYRKGLVKFKQYHKYFYVTLNTPRKRVIWSIHTLVLTTFVGPCPIGKEACHRNDIRQDNRLSNLYWGTHKENIADGLRNGKIKGNPILTTRQIKKIGFLCSRGPLGKKNHPGIKSVLSKKYGVSTQIIRRAFSKWKGIHS